MLSELEAIASNSENFEQEMIDQEPIVVIDRNSNFKFRLKPKPKPKLWPKLWPKTKF